MLKENFQKKILQIPEAHISFEIPNSFIEELEFEKVESDRSNKTLDRQMEKIKNKTPIEKNKKIKNCIEYKWENITIETKKNSKKPTKIILDNISGSAKTGEALAIIGGSGAVKTENLSFSGQTSLNGMLIQDGYTNNNKNFDTKTQNFFKSKSLDAISTYVMQDDILEPNMTPLEILIFTAKLKLHYPTKIIEEKIEKIIKILNLKNCQNTKIGNNLIRGVSGGERKRTSIAVELISDPKIIFLDEPTTGLDSYNAYELVSNLSLLAKEEEKIIIFTIHQPSSEIFYEIEKVFILADGKSVYFGPMCNSLNFFRENLKFNYPENYNPFEFFIEMTNLEVLNNSAIRKIGPYNDILGNLEGKSDEEKSKAFSDYVKLLSEIFMKKKFIEEKSDKSFLLKGNEMDFTNDKNKKEDINYFYSDEDLKNIEFADKEYIDNIIKDKTKTKGFCYEFCSLFERNTILAVRNKKILFFKVFQNLFITMNISILYYNLSKNRDGIQDRIGFIFLNILGVIFGATNATILSFSDERKVYLREYSGKMYQIPAYFLAKTLGEIPIFFISTNIYIGLLYFILQMNDTFSYKYYAYMGLLHLLTLGGTSYAFFLGSIVSDPSALADLSQILSISLLLMSGFYAAADNFAPYLIPLKYLSLFKYSFQVLIYMEFSDSQPLNCANDVDNPCDPLKGQYDFLEPFWVSLVCVVSLILVFRIFAFIFFKLRSK